VRRNHANLVAVPPLKWALPIQIVYRQAASKGAFTTIVAFTRVNCAYHFVADLQGNLYAIRSLHASGEVGKTARMSTH